MENEIVFEHKNLKIEYCPKGNYIHETWWGATPGDSFNELLEKIIEILIDKKAEGLILDAREHKGLGPKSQELAAEKIGGYAKQYRHLKQAIIVPEDVFSKFSVENFTKLLGDSNPVITQYFDNVEDAKKWLEE